MFKEYVEYYKDNPQNLWFKRKIYGWGWTPVKWQGWLSIGLYIVLVLLFASTTSKESAPKEVMFTSMLPIALLTITLIRICYKKGEAPRWQWGIPKK